MPSTAALQRSPESGRLCWWQILCLIDLIHVSVTRDLFVLKLGVELEQVTKVLHVLVMHLHSDPAIILHCHSALHHQASQGIVWRLYKPFRGTLADNQNVIHMDKNNAAAVGILENAWVGLMH